MENKDTTAFDPEMGWKNFGEKCENGEHYGLYDEPIPETIVRHEARYYPVPRTSSRLRAEGRCRGTVVLMNPAGSPARQLVMPWWTKRTSGKVSKKVAYTLWHARETYLQNRNAMWNVDDFFRILNLCDICESDSNGIPSGVWPAWGPWWLDGNFIWIAWGVGNRQWVNNAVDIIDMVAALRNKSIWIDRTGIKKGQFNKTDDNALFPLPQKQTDKDFIDSHLPDLVRDIANSLSD